METAAYLVLENGKVFKGKSFGAVGEVMGETVFTTSMTGYLETLTDRSFFGQLVVQTFPLIGNYGVIPADFESDNTLLSAYIVKDWCREPSNFRSEGDLDAFLKARGVVGLYDIDTRALTKLIREAGVMNGAVTADPAAVDLGALGRYRAHDLVRSSSTKEPYHLSAENARRKVCVLDFGLKQNILRELIKRGCDVTVLPGHSAPEDILRLAPDGIVLTNGPGDPKDNPDIIKNLQALLKAGVPLFGICLGHLLLALAAGFDTVKLKYGHRGENQPVKDLLTGRVYITSQNHGYTVVPESVSPQSAAELFRNVNDGTCEGLRYTCANALTVQFHPEACGGPRDTEFLFDRFIQMMEGTTHAAQ